MKEWDVEASATPRHGRYVAAHTPLPRPFFSGSGVEWRGVALRCVEWSGVERVRPRYQSDS
jgi:hypothetical protein